MDSQLKHEPASLVGESPSDELAQELQSLRASALTLLDFDDVRQRLADHTTFYDARRLALEITPSFDPFEVDRLQRETSDARALLDEIGDLSLHSDADTSESVTRASLEGVLTGGELLAVADSLEVHRRARSSVLRATQAAPIMADLARVIPDLREVQSQIRSKISERGEVHDDATPSLRALRSQVRTAYEKVTSALQEFIRSPTGNDSLQDPVISIRGDRLVVPVRSDRRHRVSGIVHDASNTGATVFVEPFSTVEMCNEWRELALEEEREVARVLRELSAIVGAVADDIRLANRTTAKLDFALARARYGRRLDAVGPAVGADGEHLRLIRARHPLLGSDAVPLTASIGPDWSALVITGPNTGGKTVALKTIGLIALMHQSGLQIRADGGSAIPVFDGVFADIGDQQSISDSVSTFGSHMSNVVRILRHASPRSLVLLDELGTSTDPDEGAALAKAIIAYLARRNIATVVTTHHRSVAAFAESSDDMMNASFQLDPDTLKPTYRLTVGIPGRSYAMAIAERLGLPKDILDESRSLMEPQHLLFEDWLNELQRERNLLQSSVEEASMARAEAASLRRKLEEQVEYLVDHHDDILNSARANVMGRFQSINRKLEGAEASLKWEVLPTASGAPPPTVDRIQRIRRELGAVEPLPPEPVQRPKRTSRPLAAGDRVFIRGMNLQGTVSQISDQSDEAQVSIGSVRVSLEIHRLSRIEEDAADAASPEESPVSMDLAPALDSIELDLRGMRAGDAQVKLDDFLDHAVRDGVEKLRIIHGRGTGTLRNVVREHLRYHRAVSSFGPEPRERGGNGATWVEMA